MKAITLLTLLGLLAFSQTFLWKPFEFKPYERYIYDYRETFRGKKASGGYEITVRREGDSFKVAIKGAYRNWSESVRVKVRDVYELSGFVLMRMYFDYPWLVPLGRTILSRGIVKALTSKPVDWSFGKRKVDEDTIRIVRECKYGNLKGRMIELIRKREVFFRICVSASASLPIYVYRKSESGDVFEIRLVEYSDLK